jgi:N utilization substance protein B
MKNLVNFKVEVRTREYLVQAIFQMLFNDQDVPNIINQFKDEHRNKKVNFSSFSKSLKSIKKNEDEIIDVITNLGIKDSDMELMDKSIMYLALNEMIYGDLDKPVIIDEALRLSKKFSNPESYKFINANLDKFLKYKALS